jgi:hypothetical protein
VGPRAVLDVVVKRKIPSPHQELNPRTPIIQSIAQCYTMYIDISVVTLNINRNKAQSPNMTTNTVANIA